MIELNIVYGDQINYDVLQMIEEAKKEAFVLNKDLHFEKRMNALHKRALKNVTKKENKETADILSEFEKICSEWLAFLDVQSLYQRIKKKNKIQEHQQAVLIKSILEGEL